MGNQNAKQLGEVSEFSSPDWLKDLRSLHRGVSDNNNLHSSEYGQGCDDQRKFIARKIGDILRKHDASNK